MTKAIFHYARGAHGLIEGIYAARDGQTVEVTDRTLGDDMKFVKFVGRRKPLAVYTAELEFLDD